MVARRKVAFLAALALWGGGPLAAEAAGREIVLVLFHGCHEGASSRDWKPLEDVLPEGMVLVAPELPRIEAEGDNTAWMAAWRQGGTTVVDQAFARARSDHPGAFVVAGGAGCGGFFALMGAERHFVDGLVTLSGLSDDAQRSRVTSQGTPVLGMASKNDGKVPDRVETIVVAGGPGSEMKMFPGKAHGTAILKEQPASVTDIVRWIRERAVKRGTIR